MRAQVEENIASSSPTRTAGFVTSLRAARVSTDSSQSGTDGVFMDGGVAKVIR